MKVTITLQDHAIQNQLIGMPNPVQIDIVKEKTGYRDDEALSSAFKTADLLAAGLHVLQGPDGEHWAQLTMTLYKQASDITQSDLEASNVEPSRIPRTRN
jgi:hypothetical protein